MTTDSKINLIRWLSIGLMIGANVLFIGGILAIGYIALGIFGAFEHSRLESFIEVYEPQHVFAFFGISFFMLGFAILFFGSWIGEKFLRLYFNMRKPTIREEEYLVPAMEEVKEAYQLKYGTKPSISAYVIDSEMHSAFALGSETLAISRAIIEGVSEEELSAVIAHELGHFHHEDSAYNAIFLGSNMAVSVSRLVRGVEPGDSSSKSNSEPELDQKTFALGIVKTILFFPYVAGLILSGPLRYLAHLLFPLADWKIEYRADHFAEKLGFSDELIAFLEKIRREDIRQGHGFLASYGYSHPPVATRIDAIERRHSQEVQDG